MRVKFYKNKLKCGNNELAGGNFPRRSQRSSARNDFFFADFGPLRALREIILLQNSCDPNSTDLSISFSS
jgi:hypothetical protein